MAPEFDFQHIRWKWVGLSILIFFIAQIIVSIILGIVGVLTLGLGFLLFFILKPITYFIGGYLTGRLSPGVTLTEPAIGAVIIVLLGLIFDASRTRPWGILMAIISGFLAFFLALYGAYTGERKHHGY